MRKRLGRVMDGIVSVVLASAAVGCAASDSAHYDANGEVSNGPGFEDEDSFSCTSPLPSMLANLKPASAVDYVELRSQALPDPLGPQPVASDAGSDAGAATKLPAPTTTDKSGTACATAKDHAACLTALAAATITTPSQGFVQGQDGNSREATEQVDYLVFTRGDAVGVVHSQAELVAFLGPIDTFEEVRLLLHGTSSDFACTTTPRKSGYKQDADGSWEVLLSGTYCAGIPFRRRVSVGLDGSITPIATDKFASTAVCGRRPDGLYERHAGGAARDLGAYFAEVAYLEAASVLAFRRMEEELRAFGAPTGLITRARRARADEIRHARETAVLARRFGGEVTRLEIAPETDRDLLAMAIENATEGCIRETYGALVAAFQARCAEDPQIAHVLTRIARDEARHAELSHDVAAWLDTQLDDDSRARVAKERSVAIAELYEGIRREPSEAVAEQAGMPTAREARALLLGLEEEVLAA